MNRQAALAHLDLTEEQAKDPDALKSKHDAQVSDLNRRISQASPPIAQRLRHIVEECQRAHELLKS